MADWCSVKILAILIRSRYPRPLNQPTNQYILKHLYCFSYCCTIYRFSKMLEAIKYKRGSLQLLEQRGLPNESIFIDIDGPKSCWVAIRDMTVRGAPAIAIAAALSLAVDLTNNGYGSQFPSPTDASGYIHSQLDYLVTSRPTAVNLSDAVGRLKLLATRASSSSSSSPPTAQSVVTTIIKACEHMLEEDIAANKAMGIAGAAALIEAASARGRHPPLRVLTHCNTGSLATAAFGTALGVIRTLHQQGSLGHTYATETRPYNQGARLTAFELAHDNIPATLICDSAVSALMAAGKVDAVVVGADRIAANGDTANKVGTYNLAVAAKYHNIPFFIAAPTTTIDPTLPHGSLIPIEQRDASEITHFKGQRVAAEGVDVWNPAFDVTPAAYLIEGIITEKGMIPKQQNISKNRDGESNKGATASSSFDSSFDIPAWLTALGILSDTSHHRDHQNTNSNGNSNSNSNGTSTHTNRAKTQQPSSCFYALDCDSVKQYVASHTHLAAMVGSSRFDDTSKTDWQVSEVGDGNINFVYIIHGPSGSLCVKQALPYVRCVGEDWPLSQDRIRIEAAALKEEAKHCSAHVPKLYHFDATMSVLVMQYLPPPHVILRRGVIEGEMYPALGGQLAQLLAEMLFKTSLLALPSDEYRSLVGRFTNNEMCRLTEQVIFTDPYNPNAQYNRHTSPQLDGEVKDLQSDAAVKVAVAQLKAKFCEKGQALLHGDLHTGSLMVTQSSCWLIDPEFAFYGPMGFDIGKLLANLLLAYFSCDGHAASGDDSNNDNTRSQQRKWLLQCIQETWQLFKAAFIKLWDDMYRQRQNGQTKSGDACPIEVYPDAESQCLVQKAFMDEVWDDSVRFGGAVMVRRLIGVAHVADMEEIGDVEKRAVCERRAMRMGRRMMVEGGGGGVFEDVVKMVEEAEKERRDGAQPWYE
jgi:5-methylthioribose kinase